MNITFLSIEDVMRIQERVIARDGGLAGVRDVGLLASAVTMPQQVFGGQYVHEDLAAMAAAYLFHLAKNHAFLDGNKRVALASAIMFVRANGVRETVWEDAATEVTLAVASGDMTKDQLTAWFRKVLAG